jgi:hypothetical protein
MTGPRAPLLVVLCAFLAYGACVFGEFVYDDVHAVRENQALTSLVRVPEYFVDPSLFSSLGARMYRPVLLCSYALNAAPFGVVAWAFKLGNLLLHAAAALALWWAMRTLRVGPGAALAGACLFALHPLASEAVNTASGRSELLFVGALWLAVGAHQRAIDGRRGARWVVAAATFVACGSKETGVLVPLVLAALEWLRSAPGDGWRKALDRLWPALLVVAVYLVARKLVLGIATAPVPSLTGGSEPLVGGGRDLATQLATMGTLLPRVLAQVLLPVGLSLDPPVRFHDRFLHLDVVLGWACVLTCSVLGLRSGRRAPGAFLGTCIAWATALPWVVLPLNVPLAEHRCYGLLGGIALAVVATAPLRLGPQPARWATAALAAAFLLLSCERSLLYRDEGRLWRVDLARGWHSYRAHFALGLDARAAGDLELARDHLVLALALHPRHLPAQRELVEVELQRGPRAAWSACGAARMLTEQEPGSPFHWLLRSRAERLLGEATGEPQWFDSAVASALHCLEIAPPKSLVYRTAADARLAAGDVEGALALLDQSIARGLDHVSVRMHRARLLQSAGRAAEARAEFLRAQSADPFDPDVLAFARALAAPR